MPRAVLACLLLLPACAGSKRAEPPPALQAEPAEREPKPFTGPEGDVPPPEPSRDAGGPGGSPHGTRASMQGAVERSLAWLAAHQDEDGRWDSDGFMKHDPEGDRCDGAGHALYDPGVTGLAVLAFLGAGHTPLGRPDQNPHADTVRRGLSWLLALQDESGRFGAAGHERSLYNHAIATLALCEAYWMTRHPRYKRPAQRGIDALASARNPALAWGYPEGAGRNDTSLTAWCAMALKSAAFSGLSVDRGALDGARRWIEEMTDPATGRVGYAVRGGAVDRPVGLAAQFPPERSEAMTAAGILVRIFLGEDPRTSDVVQKGADLCAGKPPRWSPADGSVDMYYWYMGTLAMFQIGGGSWRTWSEHVQGAVFGTQRAEGARGGSWDPIGPWGQDGGRVYATAILTMVLEVYYRYDRVLTIDR